MEKQKGSWDSFQHTELTERILSCAMEVSNELGAGFVESVYHEALFITLTEKGLQTEKQVPLTVIFRNHLVGKFYADLVVEDKIVLELKAAKALAPEHSAQVLNYLKASGIEVGLLINFGNSRLEFRRLVQTLKNAETA